MIVVGMGGEAENKRLGGRDVQSPCRVELAYGLCSDSRLGRGGSGALKRGTGPFGWLPGCEGKGSVRGSGWGHLPDSLLLTGLRGGWWKEKGLGGALPGQETPASPFTHLQIVTEYLLHVQSASRKSSTHRLTTLDLCTQSPSTYLSLAQLPHSVQEA
jgi:hypothetical protein